MIYSDKNNVIAAHGVIKKKRNAEPGIRQQVCVFFL